ncbi:MFS transporter [Streptomyces sp. ISL-43]|uniref:MFS transporter n=1 Tax=Streptomyces sp. ISL-43 TaxID=2819183 RepID=UPI001BEAD7B3|nr:MFS transporter [Streptomyces sp. ISL-43]MBT2447842.1 MFS transporter [Streptomyces sp. ISL-43]
MTSLAPAGPGLAPGGFLPLLATRLTSVAAAGIFFIAAAWLLIDEGGGSTEIAGLAVAMTVPSLFAALQGGVLIDRYDRRLIGRIAELARAGAVIALAVLHSAGPLALWQLYGVTLLLGLGNAVTLPCYGAMLPQVLPRRKLVSGNAIWQIATQGGGIAASALGGLLVGGGGVGIGLWTAAGCYLAAAACLLFVPRAAAPAAAQSPAARNGWRQDLAIAAQVVAADRTHLLVTVFSILPPSILAAANVLLPVFAKDQLGAGPAGFGLLEGVWGGGALLGGVLISRYAGRIRDELRTLVLSLLAVAGTMLVFAVIPRMGWSLAAATALGLTLSCSSILFPAYVQAKTPDAVLGRVLSGVQFASSVVQLLFAVAIGIGGAFVPAWLMFAVMALSLTAAAALLSALLRRARTPRTPRTPSGV